MKLTPLLWILLVFIFIICGWIFWSWYVVHNVDEPKYIILEQKNGYEIRQYEPSLIATVEVEGEYTDALNEGFRILAGFIFGGNTKQSPLAMTAPVQEQSSVAIAMTAPVSEESVGKKHLISFSMPAEYTLNSLPKPNDSRIQIREIPAQKVAALRFTGSATSERVEKKKSELVELLKNAQITTKGSPRYAGYNPPFSFPLFIRNEILMEISE